MKQLLSLALLLLIDCQRIEAPAIKGYVDAIDKTTCFYKVELWKGSVKIKDLILWVEKDNAHPSKSPVTGYLNNGGI